MDRQLAEIASWRIISELFRRYPGKFQLIETHPCGGMYDCLSLIQNSDAVAHFNRVGTLSFSDPPQLDIWRLLTEREPREVLDLVCDRLKLQIPAKLPPADAESITYRTIAGFLSHSVFGRDRWLCRNGYIDTCGMEMSGLSPFFDAFPGAMERLRYPDPAAPLTIPAYRFWFLLRENIPYLCLETSGTAWDLKGNSFDLIGLYMRERRLWSVIWQIAADLLP